MKLIHFLNEFPDEESCELSIKSYREKSGIYCKKCEKVTHHWWFSGAKFFECRHCRRRSSLKSGTIMENSKLPLQIWMLAFMFVSATKKRFSCLEFQRQLGLSRYETAFKLMHKIRSVMGRRDSLYLLKVMVEYDEGFVEVATKKHLKSQLKRGKGSRICGYFKMEVLAKADSENVNQFIKRNTDGNVVLFTDRNTAYVNLNKIVNTHFTVTSGKEETNDTLRWVHKAISNLKWNLLGIYHMVTYKYLQNYLNEFVYKLNRRYFCEKLFERLINASLHPYVYYCEYK